ncbi:hypothetical protein [Gemella morbillorum]|uniref:hypothetical protein n=1 Tax=Gemella morbillorum TaxID=29391 RepID=UPI00248EB754|nr:hypothetical protein [Gemella morbillorum]
MAIYVNKETGFEIETDSELTGDWELKKAPKKSTKKQGKVEDGVTSEEAEPEE